MITIVATGVTGGCGLAAIQQLISNNRGPYRLIIGSRHALESAEAKTAAEDLLAHRKSSKTTIDYLPLDLTSLDSVRSFAKNVKERLSEGTEGIQVDVNHLLLCAGAVCNKRRAINLSQTGTNEVEETVVVNSLSQILLTQLLLDNLDPDARVTIVNSQMHLRAPQNATPAMIKTVLGPKQWWAATAYSFSKLLMMHFAQILKRDQRFDGESRTVISVHPGFIPDTGLVRETPGIFNWFMSTIVTWFPGTITIAEGGQNIIHAMFEPDFPSGVYVKNTNLAQYSPQIDKPELRDQWRSWFIEMGVWSDDEAL